MALLSPFIALPFLRSVAQSKPSFCWKSLLAAVCLFAFASFGLAFAAEESVALYHQFLLSRIDAQEHGSLLTGLQRDAANGDRQAREQASQIVRTLAKERAMITLRASRPPDSFSVETMLSLVHQIAAVFLILVGALFFVLIFHERLDFFDSLRRLPRLVGPFVRMSLRLFLCSCLWIPVGALVAAKLAPIDLSGIAAISLLLVSFLASLFLVPRFVLSPLAALYDEGHAVDLLRQTWHRSTGNAWRILSDLTFACSCVIAMRAALWWITGSFIERLPAGFPVLLDAIMVQAGVAFVLFILVRLYQQTHSIDASADVVVTRVPTPPLLQPAS